VFTDETQTQIAGDVAAYAASLDDYAAARLDAPSLHAWLVCRLMLDCELDHDGATAVADAVLARRVSGKRTSRRLFALRRPHARHGGMRPRPGPALPGY
jgi:hypothetical protein